MTTDGAEHEPGLDAEPPERYADLYERRAMEIIEMIDPDNTLPDITLEDDPESAAGQEAASGGQRLQIAYDVNGVAVGKIQTRIPKRESAVTEMAWIYTEQPGRGFGMAMYLEKAVEVVRAGGILAADSHTGVTADGKKMWDILIDKGVATVRKPFVSIDGGRFKGDVKVLPYSN